VASGLALWGRAGAHRGRGWAPQLRRLRQPGCRTSLLASGPTRRLRSDPLAWMVTGFMGVQSLGFYATWRGSHLVEDHGWRRRGGTMVSLASVASIVVSSPRHDRSEAPGGVGSVVICLLPLRTDIRPDRRPGRPGPALDGYSSRPGRVPPSAWP